MTNPLDGNTTDVVKYNLPEAPGSTDFHSGNTLLEVVGSARVFDIQKTDDGAFMVGELCDEWFGIQLSATQLYELGAEIQQLARQVDPSLS
jgi:hypothetical protein